MNRYSLLLLLAALILFSGCSGDDDADELTGGNVIGFQCLSTGTYAQEVTANNMQNFLVSGIWAKSSGQFVPAFMNRQLVERQGTDWIYSPVLYWPSDGFVNFFAYSPAASSGVKSFQINNTNYENVVIEYDVTTDPQNQEDFVVATSLEQTGGAVQLDYQHVLSQVTFEVRGKNEDIAFSIREIALYNIDRKGTLTGTASGSPKTTTWVWSDNTSLSEKTEKLVVYQKDAILAEYNYFKSCTDPDVGGLMILPQVVTVGSQERYDWPDIWADPTLSDALVGTPKDLHEKCYIVVTYDVISYYPGTQNILGVEKTNQIAYFTLGADSDPFEFEMGKKYTFWLLFDYDPYAG